MNESESYSGNTRAPKPPKSFVTWGLCLAMLVIWVATLLFPTLIHDFAFMPTAALLEPWRLLLAAFLHSIPMPFHLGFNCWALWMMGRTLEPIMGHTKLLSSFVICVLAASLACCLTALLNLQIWLTFTAGASGAAFGFFGIMLAIQWMLRLPCIEMAALIGINFIIGFVLPNVARVARLGGLAAGLAVGGFTAWRLRHATLVEIPAHGVPTPDNPNPPKAVVLHRVTTTHDHMYDVLSYAGFVLLLSDASWLLYYFNYYTIYSLLGF